jgi:hypothetical protein
VRLRFLLFYFIEFRPSGIYCYVTGLMVLDILKDENKERIPALGPTEHQEPLTQQHRHIPEYMNDKTSF